MEEVEVNIEVVEEQQRPSYFGILPAKVRYDNNLSDKEKIFYTEISSLCNASGICTASNSYFEKLYNISTSTVSRAINGLKVAGYISVEEQRFNSGEGIKIRRNITIIDKGIEVNKPDKPKVPRKPKEEIKMHQKDIVILKLETYNKLCEIYGSERVDKTIENMIVWCKKNSQYSKDYGQRLTTWLKKIPTLKEIPNTIEEVKQEEEVEVYVAKPIEED